MESRIPLPTDNIFKFYALFGLLLFIFAAGATIHVVRSANEAVYATLPELEGLKGTEKPTPSEKIQIKILERKLQITASDKVFFDYMLGGIFLLGMLLMIVGFRRWQYHLQPLLDRASVVQLEIAELQLAKLKLEVNTAQKPKENPSPAGEDPPIV